MEISPVSPNVSSQVGNVKQSTPPPASTEVRGEKEHDGDRDDGASSPSVNTSGHTTGTTVSTAA
jgi:hypothetical protein